MAESPEEILARIRRERDAGQRRNLASDANNSRLSGESSTGDIGQADDAGGEVGATDTASGRSDWLNGWSGGQTGNGDGGPGEGEPAVAAVVSGREGNEPARGRTSEARNSPVKTKFGKPAGVFAAPSANEQRERAQMGATKRDDILKVLRVTKDGKRAQVQYTNHRFGWEETSNLQGLLLSSVTTHKGQVIDLDPEKGSRPIGPIPATPSKPQAPTGKQPLSLPKVSIPAGFKVRSGVMGDNEADRIHADFTNALDEIFRLVDKAISVTTKAYPHPKVVIWSDIDDADTDILVTMLLSLSKQNKEVAVFVRASVTYYRHARIAEILAPRFMKTWETYMMYGFDMPGSRSFRSKVRASKR